MKKKVMVTLGVSVMSSLVLYMLIDRITVQWIGFILLSFFLLIWGIVYLWHFHQLEELRETIKKEREAEKEEVDTFPVLPSRLTIKLFDGRITIKKTDIDKAVMYLSNVEDYLQRTGRTKW